MGVELMQRFEAQRGSYTSAAYKEAEVRREFVEPLFEALGWDLPNRSGYAEAYKDVIAEYSLNVGGSIKAPDYSFRIGGTRRFFVEVKRPSLDVSRDSRAAYQLRRYGWSAKLGVSVLTNFRQIAVYDCRIQPNEADSAEVARVLLLQDQEVTERWTELKELLSKEAILKGSLDAYTVALAGRRGTREVDAVFLSQLEQWREEMARDMAERNQGLSSRELNLATQLTIDRIIFLRICEDRGIEPYGQLRDLRRDRAAYPQLMEQFRLADLKYNSGLFHFSKESGRNSTVDALTPGLVLSDELLLRLVASLYYPSSPYEFSVIPAVILGQVYEQFLGSHITVVDGSIDVSEKPDVKKSGGVVYTPSHIVSLIVEETLAPLMVDAQLADVDGRSRRRAGQPIRVVDPACGSGSFLLEAYQYFLDWHLSYYVAHNPRRWSTGRHPRLRVDRSGSYQLTTEERRRILLTHIHGVDIDPAAVEVAKLSLLLKVLEHENEETLGQGRLAVERALPDLDGNIAAGNSLVGTDFLSELGAGDDELALQVSAMDWRDTFPTVFESAGFDAVIGNPPWLMAGYYLPDEALAYLRSHYRTAVGKFDLYYVFLEQSRRLLQPNGRLGMIVPNKMFHTTAARALRSTFVEQSDLAAVLDFGIEKVFPTVTNYSAILVVEPEARLRAQLRYEKRDATGRLTREFGYDKERLSSGPWIFVPPQDAVLYDRLEALAEPLSKHVRRFGTGVQTGADRIMVLSRAAAEAAQLEPELLRPFLRGRDVRRWVTDRERSLILFPYADDGGEFKLIQEKQLAEYPGVYSYLQLHRTRLAKRVWFGRSAEELSGGWYGLMYVEDAASLDAAHLLTPALASTSNFAAGDGSLFATGTAGVVSLVFRQPIHISYYAGLLNSRLLSNYVLTHSPRFQAGYVKFSKPYLKDVPVVPYELAWRMGEADNVEAAVSELARLGRLGAEARTPQEGRALKARLAAVEDKLNRAVARIYQLSESEAARLAG